MARRKKSATQESVAEYAANAQREALRAQQMAEIERQFMHQMMPPAASFLRRMLEEPPKPPTVDAAKLEALKTAEPYKVQPRVPDYFQVLTGWRAWRVTGKDGHLQLKAVGQDTVWQPKKQVEAVCVASPFRGVGSVFGVAMSLSPAHSAPHPSCECGIWAFKELDSLVAALGNKYTEIQVLGQVSLWGKVVETENGYRAEKAYPSELWLFDSELEELGLIYDVPVRLVS